MRTIAALAPVSDRRGTRRAGAGAPRILARAVHAQADLPGFDNAAMDGYALRHGEASQPLREVGRALAGHPYEQPVPPGACVRIMTGAAVPDGTDTVVMREDTRIADDCVVIERPPAAGANIRRRGEHIAAGAAVYADGQRLRSVDVALLAGLGCDAVAVRPRLRVGVLSTGDELADAPALLPAGRGLRRQPANAARPAREVSASTSSTSASAPTAPAISTPRSHGRAMPACMRCW